MGLIHLDAGVVIGFLDGDDVHHVAARAVLAEALREGDQLITADRRWPTARALRLKVTIRHC